MNAKIEIALSQIESFGDSAVWERAGLNPSPQPTIERLESTKTGFLDSLRAIASGEDLESADELRVSIAGLVDGLPWDDFDTEEKELLAVVLAPGIEAFGVDPWTIF